MNSRWSLGTKLIVFAVVAIMFGALLIGLSGRYQKSEAREYYSRDGDKNSEKEFTVNANDHLFVDVDFGDVTINGSTDGKVHVKVFMRGDEEDLERYTVSMTQENNTVYVECKHRGSRFRFFDYDGLNAQYEISVPQDFNLDLSTAGGDLKVTNVRGEVVGNTSGGNLEAISLDGDVRLGTSGGDVYGKDLKGILNLETSGGDVVIEDSYGTLKTETSGGNIKILNTDAEVNASTSGGNIRATMLSNKGIKLSTSGGNITLTLPDSVAGDVDADATGGNVSCDFPFKGKLKDDTMRGTINGGGPEITLETSGGSIDITSRND